jgi:hypothetical protein
MYSFHSAHKIWLVDKEQWITVDPGTTPTGTSTDEWKKLDMQECKLVKVLIPIGVKLSANQFPKTQEEEEDMSRAPYASVVGSLIYAMVYTRPNIAHEVGFLRRYM